MNRTDQKLSPSQASCFDALARMADSNDVLHLWTRSGLGKTTILQHLKRKLDADFLSMRNFVELQRDRDPLAIEDSLYALLEKNVQESKPLILDDLHLLLRVGKECFSNPRAGYFEAIGRAIVELITEKQSQIIIATDGKLPRALKRVAYVHGVGSLTPGDYRHLADMYGIAEQLDVNEIHRFAPRLNFYQLTDACEHCARQQSASTDVLIEYLRSRELASNVELEEVDSVDMHDLVGIDDLIESLEANVVFPLENDAIAQRYGLRPKRGVLLLGPPGTGKTTIGKALAHRLRGKFFLIDGTIISGTDHFYQHIAHIFEQAKENAPAVIFVDDSDVIFESGREHGLYRYLLTMLDGLESQSVGRVCVMMTAMDIRHIPPALIRSGRVELWLETKMPDQSARARLIENLVADLDIKKLRFDLEEVAIASDGCTPADVKRLINESKTRYAWDESRGRPTASLTQYAVEAIGDLRDLKQRYNQSRQEHAADDSRRPVWFDVAAP